jgi:MFS family permease
MGEVSLEPPVSPATNRPDPAGYRRTFAALSHRNYRLWFAGQLVSLFGTWMQSTAQGFLVYELTHSPAYLGYIGFAGGLPSWVFMLYGGVVSDRLPRRNVLLMTQAAMMVLAALLAILAFAEVARPWHILLLAAGLGLANAFDAPARQAFVSELVSREHLTNAIALNATIFNAATAVGPAMAGITYDLFGPAWCFTLNAISFVAVIGALRAMRFDGAAAPRTEAPESTGIREALRYIASQSLVRTLILLVAITSGFGFAFVTLLPAWAVNILHGGARTNGLLQSARGLGALGAALFIASLERTTRRGRLLTTGTFALPLFLTIFTLVRSLPLALATLAGVGVAFILVNSVANALVQTTVPDAMRGRVMGVYTLTFFGMMPIGALMTGTLAERFGEAAALQACACVLLAGAGLTWMLVPRLRQVP